MGGKRTHGFTLLELMIVIAVAGVILAVAIPSFRTMRQNARMTGAANDLIASINLARSEAIKRQLPVALCGSDAPRATPPSCSATVAGWVVWEDTNNDGAIAANEPILSMHDPLDPVIRVTDNFAVISYAGNGFPQGLVLPAAVLLCDERGNAAAGTFLARRVVSVSRTGRPSILKTTADMEGLDGMDPPPIASTCGP